MKSEELKKDDQALSDDELYAKIETEKLLKRQKRKKITTLCALCFCAVLALVVIILAVVPVGLAPKFMKADCSTVALYEGTSIKNSYEKEDEKYHQFIKLYKKAFSQTYLTAMFSGSLGANPPKELYQNKVENGKDNGISVVKGLAENATYFVNFHYNNAQTFTYANGKAYKSGYSTSYWNGTITFNDVFFAVSENGGMQTTTIYVIGNYPLVKDGQQYDTRRSVITLSVKGNTNLIYQAWNDFV